MAHLVKVIHEIDSRVNERMAKEAHTDALGFPVDVMAIHTPTYFVHKDNLERIKEVYNKILFEEIMKIKQGE